jgi:hypothetical protein
VHGVAFCSWQGRHMKSEFRGLSSPLSSHEHCMITSKREEINADQYMRPIPTHGPRDFYRDWAGVHPCFLDSSDAGA